jgi:tetraacyldisaccharide 4'-kinase
MLLPLAGLFVVLRTLRRWLYRAGLLPVVYLPVPVVVIGNITVGGVGKTPLVIFLAQRLTSMGWRPGIVSRGYGTGGAGVGAVRTVQLDDDPQQVGDEPLLLCNRCACPVVVGADRVAAAQHLLATHPETQVILSDDGLQHYRLGRRVEIAVTSAESEMNGWPLPAGPMRESRARLNEVDAIVSSAGAVSPEPTFSVPCFMMKTRFGDLYLLADPARKASATNLAGLRLHAVAGIGNPQRFFHQLDVLGLAVETHAFPDHHAFLAAELAFAGDAILTTEKDAVKLARLSLALPVWVLPMDISVEPDLALTVVEKLNGRSSA